MNFPTYIISLARAKDRRRSITALLDADKVQYELTDAVDGEQLDLNNCTPPVRQDICFERYVHRPKKGHEGSLVLSKGQVGCALSHIGLWKRMIAEQTPVALIMEDDARWQPDFWRIAEQLPAIEWHWDAVLLCGVTAGRHKRVICKLSDTRELVRYHRLGRRTTAYMVTLAGAKKLCRQFNEITGPIDIVWKDHWHTDMAFYEVAPPMSDHSYDTPTIDYPDKLTPLTPMHKLRRQLYRNHRNWRRRRYHLTHQPKRKPLLPQAAPLRPPAEVQTMKLPVIQSLWIGDPLSKLEQLCIQSFLDNGHEFHLYVYTAIGNVPSGVIIKDGNEILPNQFIFRDDHGSVASFSDWFRYALLIMHGGFWVDMDMICIKPFAFSESFVFGLEKENLAGVSVIGGIGGGGGGRMRSSRYATHAWLFRASINGTAPKPNYANCAGE